MIRALPAAFPGGPDMPLITIRRSCEVGESCPILAFDTETGDAIVGGPIDPSAAVELGLPSHESAVRIPASDVPKVLYDLSPRGFEVQP
ncbi:MAG: hypothetical protein LC749_01360 [Actinobacteria bacterium]|nr:hypothetical protein [Actinomycetota bacterium]